MRSSDKDGFSTDAIHVDASASLQVIQVNVAIFGDQEDHILLGTYLSKKTDTLCPGKRKYRTMYVLYHTTYLVWYVFAVSDMKYFCLQDILSHYSKVQEINFINNMADVTISLMFTLCESLLAENVNIQTCMATGKSFWASGGKKTSTAFLGNGWFPVGGVPTSMMCNCMKVKTGQGSLKKTKQKQNQIPEDPFSKHFVNYHLPSSLASDSKAE